MAQVKPLSEPRQLPVREGVSTIIEPSVKIAGAAVIATVVLFTIWFR